jgi:hypothetical protein
VIGFAKFFTVRTRPFDVLGNGTDGAFFGDVIPDLVPYDMTGEIVYTSTSQPFNKRIAFVTKPVGSATLRIEPQQDTFFSGIGFTGQTITFRAATLFCALASYV